MEDKLKKLVSLCKGSVHITFNDHTTNYSTVEEELTGNFNGMYDDVHQDVKDEMIRRNTMVNVHFYPDTPIGFYNIMHYDLDTALDEALKVLEGVNHDE